MSHFRFGPFQLDARTGELRKGPTRLKVPDQSIEILRALLEQPGDLITREQLRDRLWPSDTFVDFEHGLNAAIRRLREALGDSADAPRFIETLPRRGYRFIAPLEGALTPATAERPASLALESSSPRETVAPPVPPQADSVGPSPIGVRHITPRRLALAASIVLAAIIGLWVGRTTRSSGSLAPATAAQSIPVTSFPGVEADPALSPDGNQVAFAWDGNSGDNSDIYVKLLDAGDAVRRTTDPADDKSPAWSPDGRRIAFLRATPRGALVMVIPALGGPERQVTESQVGPRNGQFRSNGLSWTPDGRALLLVDLNASGHSAIFWCSVDTGERRPLTAPTHDASDIAPVISPDGRYLAFVRRRDSTVNLGDVFIQALDGLQPVGEPRRLTHGDTTGTLDWTHDSRSIVYEIREAGLWRVPIAGGQPQPLLMNVRATKPSVARDGTRLVYQNTTTDANIWRMPGPEAPNPRDAEPRPERIIASTFFDVSPQFSTDGRIAFVSLRTATPEIWLSRSDGSQPVQLTTLGSDFIGSPRWSRLQDFIAFDTLRSGSFNIDVVGVRDGRVHAVTAGDGGNIRPSWSADARWIYFGSKRSGEWQIWKIPPSGGNAIQITKKGGYEAYESPDGKHLYYAKPPGTPGIWEVPVEGGDEVQLIDHGRQNSWSVTDNGIALLDHLARPQATVEFFSFASQRIVNVRHFPRGVRFAPPRDPYFSVSRDGQWMIWAQYDEWGSDIHRLEGSW